jgi:TctA family transporter
VFDAFLDGLWLVLQWPAIGYLLLGVLIGVFFGAVPGLSGLTALALMLPFTYKLAPATAFAFLLGMFAVTTTADCIAAILLAIGTVASQATVLDGHAMTVKGQAARALSAAFTCSMVGGVIGAVFLALSIPVVRPLILAFASPEFFVIGVLGLTMVGVLSGKSMAKGLVAAMLGLILSFVGYAKLDGIPRFAFGTTYLLDGIPLVPMVLGFYAIPELLDLTRNQSLSHVPRDMEKGGVMQGIRDTFTHWWVVVRCSAIGIYCGLLPGLGGAIADWVAYGHVVQSSKDKSQFGKGDVRGVLAPESANNSVRGSALIPVIGFGIPGSAPMAVLMGAFLIQGLTPGPEMLTTHLNITFSLVWTLVIANIVAGLMLLPMTHWIAALAFIRGHLLFPAVMLFVLMGSWVENNHMADWICLIVFGILGYLMRLSGFPRPPLILGFVLGPVMENAYFLTTQSYRTQEWLARPICIVLILLIVLTIGLSVWNRVRGRAAAAAEPLPENPTVGAGLTLATLLVLVYGVVTARGWTYGAALFPLAVGIPAIALSLLALGLDVREIMASARARRQGFAKAAAAMLPATAEVAWAGRFLLLLVAIVLGSVLIGQKITLTAFVFLYLFFVAKTSWVKALVYAGLSFAFLELLFSRISEVIWYPSLLFG